MHGQVALSWVGSLGADCVLIANDKAATDELQKTTLRLAKPHGVKLVIKTVADSITSLKEGVTDHYKLLIVVGSVEDAKLLADSYPGITHINIGGVPPRPGATRIAKVIFLQPGEMELLGELADRDIEVEIRLLPKDRKIMFKDVRGS